MKSSHGLLFVAKGWRSHSPPQVVFGVDYLNRIWTRVVWGGQKRGMVEPCTIFPAWRHQPATFVDEVHSSTESSEARETKRNMDYPVASEG